MKLPSSFFYKNNRFQQLRGFYYTVQLGSMTRAAKRMSLNISAISMQISALESELNIQLLQPNGRGVLPTNEGKEMYQLAHQLVEGIDSVFERFFNLNHLAKNKELTIVANNNSMHYFLPEIIGSFKKTYPEVFLNVQNTSREEAYNILREDRADLFAGAVNEIPNDFQFYPVMTSEVVLVVCKDHALTKVKRLTLEKIAKFELIRLDSKHVIVPFFEEVVKSYDFKTKMNLIGADWQILKNFVRETKGFTITAAIALKPHEKGLTSISLKKWFPNIKYGVLVKQGRKPFSERCRDFVNTATKTWQN